MFFDDRLLPGRLRNYLKSHIKLRDTTYSELAQALQKYGLDESEATIANKISRGAFSAEFFVGCLLAMGVRNPDFSYLDDGE